VGANDVHFTGPGRADFRANDLFARAGSGRLRVERAKFRIGLRFWIVVHARGHRNAADARASGAGADFPAGHGNGHAALRPPLRSGSLYSYLMRAVSLELFKLRS